MVLELVFRLGFPLGLLLGLRLACTSPGSTTAWKSELPGSSGLASTHTSAAIAERRAPSAAGTAVEMASHAGRTDAACAPSASAHTERST